MSLFYVMFKISDVQSIARRTIFIKTTLFLETKLYTLPYCGKHIFKHTSSLMSIIQCVFDVIDSIARHRIQRVLYTVVKSLAQFCLIF